MHVGDEDVAAQLLPTALTERSLHSRAAPQPLCKPDDPPQAATAGSAREGASHAYGLGRGWGEPNGPLRSASEGAGSANRHSPGREPECPFASIQWVVHKSKPEQASLSCRVAQR